MPTEKSYTFQRFSDALVLNSLFGLEPPGLPFTVETHLKKTDITYISVLIQLTPHTDLSVLSLNQLL